MGSLVANTVPVSTVGAAERDAMWAVFERYYEDVDRARFERDLAGKDDVILLRHQGAIVGFSTVVVEREWIEGREIVSVFSGDTVIDAAHYGQTALQWAFFRYVAGVKLRNPHKTVVWFLISKGYKTYLLLARNFATFWPRRDQATPAWARTLIETLASRRFGEAFDPDRGILTFDSDHERLKEHVAPTEGVHDPDVRFFEQANPGHAAGDELCCVGVVDAKLILGYPLKLLRRRG